MEDSNLIEPFRIQQFTRNAYDYKAGFWIPQDIKRKLQWTEDVEIGLIIFNEVGTRLFDGALSSISGGEVYLRELGKGEMLHVVAFLPARSQSFVAAARG